MISKYYETIFEVTETCQNGNERRIKKSVLSPVFRDGKHCIDFNRIDKAAKTLSDLHYYDIEYIKTITKTIIWEVR